MILLRKWKLPNTNTKAEVSTNSFNIWVVFMSNDIRDNSTMSTQWQVTPASIQISCFFTLTLLIKSVQAHKYFQIPLSLVIPIIGERIVAFGFPKSKVNIRKDNLGTSHIEINDEPSVSVGEIKEVYPEKGETPSCLPFLVSERMRD